MVSIAAKSLPKLSGAVFGQFSRRKQLIQRHWLDTRTDQYYDVLRRIVVPECKNIASDVPEYPERIEKLLYYTNPAFSDAWNFTTELIYRTVADESHQTEENITKMYLIRATMDLLFTMSAVLDDISDRSEFRKGKKGWHMICQGGESTALYDGTQMGLFPLYLLKQYFKNDPGYSRLLETVVMTYIKLTIGQTIDVLGQFKKSPSMAEYKRINYYKAGQFVAAGSELAVIHAGITSQDLIDKTVEIFTIAGQIIQTWDDFNDYYSSSEQNGKLSCDFMNAGTTWVSAKAMEVFTPSQAVKFMECYGSDDQSKMKTVQELYDEIDMPKLYTEYVLENYNRCETLIKELPHDRLREACSSYMEWLVVRETPDEDSEHKVALCLNISG
uniref:Sesquiterpene alcohol synthase n=1 Tax=Murgantia histrionica TaxID=460024 RepID=TPS_MURHI|nr:RecName: Full=Sesquiterpene alcohol synthase; Short=MhTPS [Murgantia histrionica]AVZ23977.1 terpene synthase [Murgantia histrionica]